MSAQDFAKEILPLVSVCIPNYNYGQFLDHCLESVYNQTYPNIEVYFRDNRSTDNSYETALKWRERFRKKGIYLGVSDNKRNMGSDKNSKLATRDTEGEFVYTLASDDAIKPEFIESCINIFLNNPRVGTVITHREEIDDDDNIYKTPSFYNKNCIIEGESQAAVYMMAGIAIPGQRMVRRTVLDTASKYARIFQVAGDWYDNFLYSLVGDVAYIKEPLCQYRVHMGNETNESEKKLLGITEHYQLIHAFYDLADSFGLKKPQERYSEAVKKLGTMCLRYALKMYKNNYNEIAYKYLLLAPVYNSDITNDEKYCNLLAMKSMTKETLKNAIIEFEKKYCLERTLSYAPPKEHWEIDKKGCIIT